MVLMLSLAILHPILDNEALTRGLGDMEARMLVEWLVDEADRRSADADDGHRQVRHLCRWARAVSRFVYLWCHAGEFGAAIQLAATERRRTIANLKIINKAGMPWHGDPDSVVDVLVEIIAVAVTGHLQFPTRREYFYAKLAHDVRQARNKISRSWSRSSGN